ncbi:MAG: type II toxin-antitoxin system HicB family antitoxin [Cyclobacteriaceae bacterium]|mgnify:CR=1 FL=1
MKEPITFTAHIEQDLESGLYVGFIPNLPGAHTQAETLDELKSNLAEVALLCLEELSSEEWRALSTNFVGTQQITVAL